MGPIASNRVGKTSSLGLRLGLVAALLFAPVASVQAAAPGVPALGSSPAAYVQYAETNLPSHFTTGLLPNQFDNTPVENPITDAGAELGRVLFYDQRLSHNNGTACASCHTQETGFADENQFSVGFEGGLTGRHSMALTNARWYASGRFFWDERAATLEDQVLQPIQDEVEMGSNLEELVEELRATDFYPELFERAFDDSTITSERMSQAMAQFVRSMASYQSPFDRALEAGTNGDPDFDAVPEVDNPALATIGHGVFGAACARCHQTDAQVASRTFNTGLDATITDDGAGNGEFKTPSLRNVAVREGFMHDGRFTTLEEVIEFYSSGVQDNPGLSRGLPVGGLGFTESQKEALLAFLETLTDDDFLTSELFSNPFVPLAGDYDGSGVVDEGDYAAWRSAFGLTSADQTGPLMADGNGDGVIDAADYTIWRGNFGARWDDATIASAIASVVPEPATAFLLSMAICALPRRIRRRRDSHHQ